MAASNKIQVGYIEAQDGAQFQVDAGTAAAPGLCFDDSTATGLYSPGTGQIAWSTSGKQTALRILADGKVGVDCSPTVALEVNGTIKASAIDAPIEGTLDDWIIHAGDTNTKFGFPAVDTFSVETSGSSRLYIKSDGKIGINTTTPNSALEVQGDGGVNDATITFTRLGSPSNGSVIGSNFYRIGTDSVAGMGAYRESAMDDAYLAFHTQPTGGNFTERLRITSGGIVRIKRTASTTLNNDTIYLALGDTENGANSNRMIGFGYVATLGTSVYPASIGYTETDNSSNTKGALVFNTRNTTGATDAPTERLRIKSDGGIRLVKTGGNANFTISRNESVTSNDATVGVIDFANNTAHTVNSRIMGKTAGTSNVGGDLVVETRADGGSLTEKLRIKGSGEVRIGANSTTASTAGDDLVIEGSSDRGLSIISGTSSSANIYFGDSSDADIGRIAYQHNDNALDFSVNAGSTALRIDSSGRLLVGSTAKAGDSALQVYTADRKHPAIRTNSPNANGYPILSDAYKADESQVNIGISYSSASLVLSSGCKVSDSSDDAYLSSQDTYSTRPCALRIDTDGSLSFHSTETNATTTTDSAVSLTEVFKVDKVGNIYQKISNRYMWFGASNQLQIGVNGSDPYINSNSGDLQVRDAGNVCYVVRHDNLQMYMDIKMNQGKGISFINAADTATGETVSSSVLDEYEEGDWTPSNAHLTVNNVYSARYIKVGRIVHLSFAISFAASPSDTAQTAWIDGLPFQSHNKAQYITLDWVGTSSAANYRNTNTEHVIFANSSRLTFYYPTSAHAQTRAHIAGKQVRGTFTYLASA